MTRITRTLPSSRGFDPFASRGPEGARAGYMLPVLLGPGGSFRSTPSPREVASFLVGAAAALGALCAAGWMLT